MKTSTLPVHALLPRSGATSEITNDYDLIEANGLFPCIFTILAAPVYFLRGLFPQEDEESASHDNGDDDDDADNNNFHAETEAMLRPMYEACAASQKLENAAMLSVVTAEALSACRERLEESSLGRVAIGGGELWVVLSRRLRMCLFFDHRLHSGVSAEQAR